MGANIITRANACHYKKQRCISIQIKLKTDYTSTSSTRKGKKAKASSANLSRFLLLFEHLLSPVFGLVDGPHTRSVQGSWNHVTQKEGTGCATVHGVVRVYTERGGDFPREGLVNALTHFPRPVSRTDARSFCRLVQQFEAFSPDITAMKKPITEIMSTKSVFQWRPRQEEAFRRVIAELQNPKVLAQYRP